MLLREMDGILFEETSGRNHHLLLPPPNFNKRHIAQRRQLRRPRRELHLSPRPIAIHVRRVERSSWSLHLHHCFETNFLWNPSPQLELSVLHTTPSQRTNIGEDFNRRRSPSANTKEIPYSENSPCRHSETHASRLFLPLSIISDVHLLLQEESTLPDSESTSVPLSA
jgi:hypothetical protein